MPIGSVIYPGIWSACGAWVSRNKLTIFAAALFLSHDLSLTTVPQHIHTLLGWCMSYVLAGPAHEAFLLCTVQAAWHETSQYSCLRACVCPPGGGPCTPSSHCSPNEFACKHAYKRFSDNSARCYPVGCQEGALQVSLQFFFSPMCGFPSIYLCWLHHYCMPACSPRLAFAKCCNGLQSQTCGPFAQCKCQLHVCNDILSAFV